MKTILNALSLTGLLVLGSTAAHAAPLIDINFTDSSHLYSGAGAVGSASDVWNNLNYSSTGNFTSGVLLDSTGSTTAVGFSPGVKITTAGFDGNGGGFNSTGNFALNLFSNAIEAYGSDISITYTFTGLAFNTTYQLELYTTNYDQGGGFGLQRAVTFSTNDGSAQASDAVATAAFSAGDNYASLTGTTNGQGVLVITGINTAPHGFGGEIDLTGVQLQAVSSVPEPNTATMLILGMGLLAVCIRRRLACT